MNALQTAGAATLESYFREATAWDRDRIAGYALAARRAWWVAVAAVICAVAASLALVLLTPLKRVDPFLVRVDNSTGLVDVVPIYAGQSGMDESVTRYFLSHYVATCERFNLATAESDYEECGAFHTAARNQAWYAQWNTNNPLSPLNLHKDGSLVSIHIESVSFFKRANGVTDLAQVRYIKADRVDTAAPERASHWIATIQYAYGAPSGRAEVRRWNPLGFKVLEFTAEPEVSHEAGAGAPTSGSLASVAP